VHIYHEFYMVLCRRLKFALVPIDSMKQDSLEFKMQIILKEWDSLLSKMEKHDNQISSIRNWCILTLTGISGFILAQINASEVKGWGIFLLPLFVIFFFAINEFVVQMWKWEAIERLYDLDILLRSYHKKGILMCEPKFYEDKTVLIEHEPSLVSDETRKKLRRERASSSFCDKNLVRRSIKNTILAYNYFLFYFLIWAIISFLIIYLVRSISKTSGFLCALFFLIITVPIVWTCWLKNQK
jgi:hypothetical protein